MIETATYVRWLEDLINEDVLSADCGRASQGLSEVSGRSL